MTLYPFAMHPTALNNAESFFSSYLAPGNLATSDSLVVDVGSFSVNGSLRQVFGDKVRYVGVDVEKGPGVDVVLKDPYQLPFGDATVDCVVSSSCFEHSEFFWSLFLEIVRVLKPTGLFYLCAPSAGSFHRYPVDCWRFYPDSGVALERWGSANGFNVALLESFIQVGGDWNDFVAVFVKDENASVHFPGRMSDIRGDVENVRIYGVQEVRRHVKHSQAMRAIRMKSHRPSLISENFNARVILVRLMRLGALALSRLKDVGVMRSLARVFRR